MSETVKAKLNTIKEVASRVCGYALIFIAVGLFAVFWVAVVVFAFTGYSIH